MAWCGRLVFRDIEGGVWLLRTREGDFALRGAISPKLDGREVQVEGILKEGVSLHMAGRVIEVRRISAKN